ILSPGSADADPLCLSHALVAVAVARGASIFDAEAVSYDSTARGVLVGLDSGLWIEAERVVLATGYVMPDFLKTDLHTTASSWAIATPPQTPDALWRDGVLIWEASEKYLYARTTADNRIIIGGEDDNEIVDPTKRDELMPKKAAAILDKLKVLYPKANATADFVWSGAFGETTDGLPLIGQVPGHPRLFAAYGYGGNGITFSFLASRMIGQMIAGRHEPWFQHFAVDRPSPKG
ncbi:MAG: FAD-binding oxidoreductase, partial [Alphaproteobacteria bacterium]